MIDSLNDLNNRRINVLYQSSQLYGPILGISLMSLLETNERVGEIYIYIIDGGIGSDDRYKIQSLCNYYHRNCIFYQDQESTICFIKEALKDGVIHMQCIINFML